MDFSIEVFFVNNCIKTEYRERLLFELQSKKHREKAISRFAHSAETILKNGFVKTRFSDLKNCFKANDLEMCYVISGGLYDGDKLLFKDAIGFLNASYLPVILISSKIIMIKEEFENKQPALFLYQIN